MSYRYRCHYYNIKIHKLAYLPHKDNEIHKINIVLMFLLLSMKKGLFFKKKKRLFFGKKAKFLEKKWLFLEKTWLLFC